MHISHIFYSRRKMNEAKTIIKKMILFASSAINITNIPFIMPCFLSICSDIL